MAGEVAPLLLRLESGPSGTGFALLRAGEEVRIGRERSAALHVDDPLVSREHALVRMDVAGRVFVCDLRSRNGTRVNGEPLRGEREIRAGDRIEVGDSTLVLASLAVTERPPEARRRVEAPPAEAAPSEAAGPREPLRAFAWIEPMRGLRLPPLAPPLARLARRVADESAAGSGERLYVLLDAARDEQAAAAFALRGHALYTLFEGDWAEPLAHVGPCLVPAEPPEPVLDLWLQSPGRNLGILLDGPASLPDLLRHLRSVFVCTDEEGQEYFFRFYDPRVLRPFLPTCRPDELREFFGPVQRIYVEDPGLPDGLRVLSLGEGGRLVTRDLLGEPPVERPGATA